MFILLTLIKILIIIVPLLISVAYFTLAERKIMGAIQRRKGPNVIGVFGLLQPLADGFKLLVKETILPSNANKFLFLLSPIITFVISLMGWAIIPYDKTALLSEINIGILYIFAVSSLGVYGIIMSGWSSNSKYAFLGALRSAAQMVSYEVSIGFIIATIVVCCGSFNLQIIIESQKNVWFVIPFFPLFLMFFISALAETNRHPFDLPEAEAELVSGYNVEYSAMGFALFSLGEYANMLLMSSLNVILFFGGWLAPLNILNFIPGSIWFGIKICFFVILYIWMRAALPRYRYDQLMALGWKIFLPISLTYLMLTFFILISFNILPF
jgi:NADH-quinone oxidoreductase subunit H